MNKMNEDYTLQAPMELGDNESTLAVELISHLAETMAYGEAVMKVAEYACAIRNSDQPQGLLS